MREQGKLKTGENVALALSKISLVLRQQAWEQGFAQELTPTQGQVLAHLASQPGSSLASVAEAIGIRAPTASDAVSTLEGKGLLSKSPSPEDRRRLVLALTAKGRDAAASVALWPDLLASVTAELDPAEQGALLRTLQRMIRRLQQRGAIPVGRMCVTCRFFSPNRYSDRAKPHHCGFVDAPFGDLDLRSDCSDHEEASQEVAANAWAALAP